jgi:hypothetical protein
MLSIYECISIGMHEGVDSSLLALEMDGGRPQAKKSWQPLEAGRCKNIFRLSVKEHALIAPQ